MKNSLSTGAEERYQLTAPKPRPVIRYLRVFQLNKNKEIEKRKISCHPRQKPFRQPKQQSCWNSFKSYGLPSTHESSL